MKFRGKIAEEAGVQHFAYVVHMILKCSRQCILRICPDKLIFIITNSETKSDCWCEFPKIPYFSEFTMEGVTAESNEIYLDISTEHLAACVHSCLKPHAVMCLKMKLTKKNMPCLSFELDTQQANSNTPSTIVHDMNVNIVKRMFWPEYKEPTVPDFDVSVEMPDLRTVRHNVERLKTIGPKLNLIASKNGRLIFRVSNNTVKCSIKYSDLKVYNLTDDDDTEDLPVKYSVLIDSKQIGLLIPKEDFKPTKCICSLLDKKMIHLFYFYGDVSLQYFLKGDIEE